MNLKRRFNKNRLIAAISRDSFYVILFLCLILLAATAVWVTKSNLEYFGQGDLPNTEDELDGEYEMAGAGASGSFTGDNGTNPAVLIEDMPDEADESDGGLSDKNDADGKDTGERKNITVRETVPVKDTTMAKATSQVPVTSLSTEKKPDTSSEGMIMPVLGKICMDFGKDNLVYSKTLEQWTTHYGIDIAASIGTPVKAVKSGKVTEITNHSELGIMITIDHGDALVTRYANLQNNNMVKKGQKIEQGKVISGVGNTAEFEIGDVPHLHFEVIKNGNHEDPKLYLPNM